MQKAKRRIVWRRRWPPSSLQSLKQRVTDAPSTTCSDSANKIPRNTEPGTWTLPKEHLCVFRGKDLGGDFLETCLSLSALTTSSTAGCWDEEAVVPSSS